MNNENNWLYSQINAIAEHACGPAGYEQDVGELRDLVLALQRASVRIECVIARRVATGRAAGDRWA
jgi:hypothetical protein